MSVENGSHHFLSKRGVAGAIVLGGIALKIRSEIRHGQDVRAHRKAIAAANRERINVLARDSMRTETGDYSSLTEDIPHGFH